MLPQNRGTSPKAPSGPTRRVLEVAGKLTRKERFSDGADPPRKSFEGLAFLARQSPFPFWSCVRHGGASRSPPHLPYATLQGAKSYTSREISSIGPFTRLVMSSRRSADAALSRHASTPTIQFELLLRPWIQMPPPAAIRCLCLDSGTCTFLIILSSAL